MTEQEWLSGDDGSFEMIAALQDLGRADARKLRLYACAWARLLWDSLGHKTHKRTIELAEDFADGLIAFEELAAARELAVEFRELYETTEDQASVCPGRAAFATADEDAASAAWDACYHASNVFEYLRIVPSHPPPRREEQRLMREIFGNPFRPSQADLAWLAHASGAVARLARSAHDERIPPRAALDPARLAVLADALEEAGCSNREMLDHLRDPGPHVRGCWVVDLLLEQAGGFATPPRGRKKRKSKAVESALFHTVEDILEAASRLAPSEITRLKEGLLRLEQERSKAQPRKGRTKK
jgi:hypothetical protein